MSEAIAAKLDEARALIGKGWCQENFAYYGGDPVIDDGDVTEDCDCYCAVGALRCAAGADFEQAHRYLVQATATPCTIDWNDAPERTQAEVIEAFRKAAELARGDLVDPLEQVKL